MKVIHKRKLAGFQYTLCGAYNMVSWDGIRFMGGWTDEHRWAWKFVTCKRCKEKRER